MEFVSLEEIGVGIRALVNAQVGIGRDDLVTQTARLLGFSSAGARTKSRIDEAITSQVNNGTLTQSADGGFR